MSTVIQPQDVSGYFFLNLAKFRARNSARIRESILTMILVASRYENQFLSLNYVVNTTVTQNFDSRKSKRNSTPEQITLQFACIFWNLFGIWYETNSKEIRKTLTIYLGFAFRV